MSPRALANLEREEQAQRMSKLGRSSLLLLATILSFGTIGLLAADQLYRPDTFVIDQLKIRGKFRHIEPAVIESVVNQDSVGNFFSIELDEIKKRIETLEWIQSAEVRREWPNTLLINVSEHQPVMRWNKNNADSLWVNSLGMVVKLSGKVDLIEPILLSGNDQESGLVLRQAYLWKQQLAGSGLVLRAVALSGSHSWQLSIAYQEGNARFGLFLGREDIEQRLARFIQLFDQRFKGRDKQLQRVDARYPNGLAIKSVLVERRSDEPNKQHENI